MDSTMVCQEPLEVSLHLNLYIYFPWHQTQPQPLHQIINRTVGIIMGRDSKHPATKVSYYDLYLYILKPDLLREFTFNLLPLI